MNILEFKQIAVLALLKVSGQTEMTPEIEQEAVKISQAAITYADKFCSGVIERQAGLRKTY